MVLDLEICDFVSKIWSLYTCPTVQSSHHFRNAYARKSAINKLAKNGKFILECNENIYDSVGMDQFNIGDTKLYMYTKL